MPSRPVISSTRHIRRFLMENIPSRYCMIVLFHFIIYELLSVYVIFIINVMVEISLLLKVINRCFWVTLLARKDGESTIWIVV